MRLLLKKFLAIASGNVGLSISSFLIASFIVRKYGIQQYGEFVVAQSMLMLLPVIIKPMTWQSMVRYKNNMNVGELFWLSLFCELIFSVSISLVMFSGLYVCKKIGLGSDFLLFSNYNIAVVIVLSSLFFNSGAVVGYFRAKEEYNVMSIILLLSSGIKVLFVFFSTLHIDDLIILLCAIDGFFWLFVISWLAYKNIDFLSGAVNCSWSFYKKFIRYSLWGNFHGVLDLPVSQLDRLIIAALFSNEVVGIFNLIKRIGGVVGQISEPIAQILFPRFVDLIKLKCLIGIKTAIRKMLIMAIVLTPIVLLFGVLSFSFLDGLFFAGQLEKYKWQVIAYVLLQIGLLGFIWVHPLCTSISAMLEISVITAISNVSYLVVLYFSMYYFNMWGIVISSFIQYSMVVSMKIYVINKKVFIYE